MILFESPFKIKLSFYEHNDVAITFLTYLFKYVENLNKNNLSRDPQDREWASCSLNVSFQRLVYNNLEKISSGFGRLADILLLQAP